MTSFSPTAMELCAQGQGIAWLPERLLADKLVRGGIKILRDPDLFPSQTVDLVMLRVRTRGTGFVNAAWDTLRLLFLSEA